MDVDSQTYRRFYKVQDISMLQVSHYSPTHFVDHGP